MFLIAHETEADASHSAELLLSLGSRCISLMTELVTEQEISKNTLSKTILTLESQDFLRIRDASTLWQKNFIITPTLLGEEALCSHLDKNNRENQ